MKTGRFTTLETDRLLLRRLREPDLVPVLAHRNDPEVFRYQDWEGCTEAEARGMIQALGRGEPFVPGEWFQFAVELREIGELAGDLGFRITEDGRQGEVGYTLAREHWGKGYATEAVSRLLDHAFGVLGLHRVYASWTRRTRPLPPSWRGSACAARAPLPRTPGSRDAGPASSCTQHSARSGSREKTGRGRACPRQGCRGRRRSIASAPPEGPATPPGSS